MIELKLNKWGEINILDPIGETDIFSKKYSYKDFVTDLEEVNGELRINISTLGGSAKEAMSIYDHLRSVSYPVVTRIVGNTASAGTVISLAGDIREMTPNSRYFIHRAQLQLEGNADQIRQASLLGDEYDKKILKLYVDRTGKSEEEIWNLMQRETWLSAEEALQWGFITNIIQDMKKVDQKIKNSVPEEVENLEEDKDEIIARLEKEIEELRAPKLEEGVEEAPEGPLPVQEPEAEAPAEEEDEGVIAALKAEIAQLRAKLEEKEIEEAEVKAQRVDEIVENFHKSGLITGKEHWLHVGLNMEFDKFEGLLKSITKSETITKLSDKINLKTGSSAFDTKEKIMEDYHNNKINRGEMSKRLKNINL